MRPPAGKILVALLILSGSVSSQEMTCKELLLQCGDGPGITRQENNTVSRVGGGPISTQCVGILSGVLATYENCHGQLTWAGAAQVLIHFVHAKPELMKTTGWECAQAVFQNVFGCRKE
jgi:hypothetical protein